jgi:outer membrane immunogenic protein
MRKFLLAGVIFGLLSTAAAAADLGGPYPRRGSVKDVAEPYYPPPFTWSGLYFGLQAGWAWGDVDATTTIPTEAFSYNTDGFLGGAHVGVNWQSGALVYGLEADLEGSGLGGSGIGTFGNIHSTDLNWLGSVRARLGVAVAPRTLLYATGGWAFGDVEINSSVGSFDSTRTGWTAGAGVEHAISPFTTVRLEYRFTDLGSETFTNGLRTDTSDVSFSAIRAGISWKF